VRAPRRPTVVALVLPLLLLLALGALALARAGRETSLWMDETSSLVLAHQPAWFVYDVSAVDFNPPGYFLLLGRWLRLGRLAGFVPGITWARSLGLVAWAVLALLAWRAGRRLAGDAGGLLLTLAVAASANATLLANEARGYGVASAALFACFVCLLGAHWDDQEAELLVAAGGARPRLGRDVARWTCYAVAAALAAWMHLLAAVAVAMLALLWLILCVDRLLDPTARRRAWRTRFALLGAAAHAVAGVAFLPWLMELRGQLGSLRASSPRWMTAADGFNLASVFWYWLPFGRVGMPRHPPGMLFPVLGALTLLVPLVALAVAWRKGWPTEADRPSRRCLGLLAAAGLGLPLAFVATLWCVQRAGIASVFHAPRYPALASAIWAAGLFGLAARAGLAFPRRTLATALLLLPWLASAALGQWWAWRLEGEGGLAAGLARLAEQAQAGDASVAGAPPAGAVVYVMPSELMPFQATALARFRARPVEELPCGLRDVDEAWLLNLSRPWGLFDRMRDLVARRAVTSPAIVASIERTRFPPGSEDYELSRLRGVSHERAGALCDAGLSPLREIPADAVAVALPEAQRYTDGWSYPEVNADRVAYRWSSAPEARVRFDRPLLPGEYVVRFVGYRTQLPLDPAPVAFSFGGATETTWRPAGEISLSLEVRLERGMRRPLLVVRHPTWRPVGSSGDARTLGAALLFAWVERRR
jgi:hypothetical protein